jgi:uncharacterized membrane protein YidH (DUF202 family)
MDSQVDSNELANLRTKMAYGRTRKASERTLMAWIRTSLSMISFGFSIDTFFRSYLKAQQGKAELLRGPEILGLVLVGLGTLVLILGTVDHFLYVRKLGEETHFEGKKAPWTFMFYISLFIITIGIVIFCYMLMQAK